MKVLKNLEISLQGSGTPIKMVAVCYQNEHTQALAQKVAELLPYPHFLVNAAEEDPASTRLGQASHAVELYNPYGEYYDHCRLVRQAMFQNQCCIVDLYDWQKEYFQDAFWGNMDYRNLKAHLEKIKQQLLTIKKLRITSPEGTDISFSTYGRDWIVADGLTRNDELSQMPDGELYTCPVESSFNGVLMVDGTITRGWVPAKPLRLEFKNGRISGGDVELLEYIGRLGPDAQLIGEFAMGFNAAYVPLHHNISVDEKGLGTVHFAVGDSYDLGINHCVAHCDMLIRHPVLHLDPYLELPGFKTAPWSAQ